MLRFVRSTSVLRLPVILQRTLSESAPAQEVEQELPDNQEVGNTPTRIKVTLPRWSVGPFIGERFENINRIQNETNSHLKISRWGNFFPNSLERVLMIEGKTDDVLNAIYKIYDSFRMVEVPEYVKNPQAANERKKGISLITPLSLAKDFNDFKGKNKSHTTQNFQLDQFYIYEKQKFHDDLKERIIHIRGEEDNVKNAVNFVVQKLSSGPKVDDNLNYRQFYINDEGGSRDE